MHLLSVKLESINPEAFVDIQNTLTQLALDNNLLDTIPTESLRPLGGLTYLSLRGNKIMHVDLGSFQNLINLKFLYLQNNQITTIMYDSFQSLVALYLLNLKENLITNFVADLQNVEFLYLDRCSIRKIFLTLQMISDDGVTNQNHENTSVFDPHMLPYLNQTTYLGLSFNLLETNDVCSQIWKYSTKLKTLQLGNNMIYSISTGCFKYLQSLKSLYLGENNISFIEEYGFGGLEELRTLSLVGNHLTYVDNTSLAGMHKLNRLSLRNNQIRRILEDSFVCTARLTSLNLGNNYLEGQNNACNLVWRNLLNLKYLFLDGNRINALTNNCFIHLVSLQTLDLSGNNISDLVSDAFRGLDRLTSLVLTHNNIQQLRNDTFPRDFYNLMYLYIDQNQIEIIHHNSFLPLTNLKGLYLEKNFLATSAMCQTVQHNLTSLTMLKLGSNVINAIPYGCFNQLTSLKYLYLQNNLISQMDDNAFFRLGNLKDLFLQHNELKLLKSRTFFGLHDLLLLDVSHNRIHYVEPEAFSSMPKLRSLYLRGNDIVTLSPNTFTSETHVFISLDHNPLVCNCSMSWLKSKFILVRNDSNCTRVANTGNRTESVKQFVTDRCKVRPTIQPGVDTSSSFAERSNLFIIIVIVMVILLTALVLTLFRIFKQCPHHSRPHVGTLPASGPSGVI